MHAQPFERGGAPGARRSRLALAAIALGLAACSASPSTSTAPTSATGGSGQPATTTFSLTPGSGAPPATTPGTTGTAGSAAATTALVVDPNKDYGNKYADGILPVGDSKFVTDAPKAGYVYSCRAQTGGGGAFTRGPWFINDNTEYDLNKKVKVEGSVRWDGNLQMSTAEGKRVIRTNDVPDDHPTGVFPVSPSDPAYQYDRNPNAIQEQTLTYTLPLTPSINEEPACQGGEVGVMTTGVALFNAFDAGGRDAGAWEVQDGCDGHPQISGEYHYHTLSSCITDASVSTVIGWALDGFPITGPKVAENNILTTGDLDECHGITGMVTLDGRTVATYHYVMTQDFPYSVACFRGTPSAAPRSDGGGAGGQGARPPGPPRR